MVPFSSCQYPRNDVKRENFLYTGFVTVNGKRNALVHEKLTGQFIFLLQGLQWVFTEIIIHLSILCTDILFMAHLVPRSRVGLVKFKKIVPCHKSWFEMKKVAPHAWMCKQPYDRI